MLFLREFLTYWFHVWLNARLTSTRLTPLKNIMSSVEWCNAWGLTSLTASHRNLKNLWYVHLAQWVDHWGHWVNGIFFIIGIWGVYVQQLKTNTYFRLVYVLLNSCEEFWNSILKFMLINKTPYESVI